LHEWDAGSIQVSARVVDSLRSLSRRRAYDAASPVDGDPNPHNSAAPSRTGAKFADDPTLATNVGQSPGQCRQPNTSFYRWIPASENRPGRSAAVVRIEAGLTVQ